MITLPPLPYSYEALAPVISSLTMRLHHDKHHAAYVTKTNDLAAKAGIADRPLEAIIAAAADEGHTSLANNAGQAWNHTFFWLSMSPIAKSPTGDLASLIKAQFGDEAAFRRAFVDAGAAHFGSGWVWLVQSGEHLEVRTTHDAGNFIGDAATRPLLVCDLWEHAYYLDHQNNRKAFLEAWVDRLANWEFAASRLRAGLTTAAGLADATAR